MTFACWPTSSEWIQPTRLCGYARTSTLTNPYPRDQPPCFRSFSADDSESSLLHAQVDTFTTASIWPHDMAAEAGRCAPGGTLRPGSPPPAAAPGHGPP